MKKKIILLVAMVAVLIASGIAIGTNYLKNLSEKKNTQVETTKESETKQTYQVSYTSDYLYTKPEDLYEQSELVVIAEYDNDIKTFMGDDQRAHTISSFKVLNVIKGKYVESTIAVLYAGGTVPLSEFIATQNEEQLAKKGLDKLSKTEIENSKVEFVSSEHALKFAEKNVSMETNNTKQQYILFLNYNQEYGSYVSISDEYGILEFDNFNKTIYNIDSKSYTKVEFIE